MKTVEDVGSPLKYEFQVRGLRSPGLETSGKGDGAFLSVWDLRVLRVGIGEMEMVILTPLVPTGGPSGRRSGSPGDPGPRAGVAL